MQSAVEHTNFFENRATSSFEGFDAPHSGRGVQPVLSS